MIWSCWRAAFHARLPRVLEVSLKLIVLLLAFTELSFVCILGDVSHSGRWLIIEYGFVLVYVVPEQPWPV